MAKKRAFFWILLFVSIFVMIVVNIGGTLGFFYDSNGKIITSSFNGEINLGSDVTHEDQTYSNSNDASNVFVISGGTSSFNRINMIKGGNGNSENGINGGNAAALVINQAFLRLTDGSITTDGEYADGVFSYNNGNIRLSSSTVLAKSNHSSGIVVSGGGIVVSENSNIKTLSNYSPAIRNTEGRGAIQVSGGTYETEGNNSPVLLSTATLFVDSANLVANKSEGIVVYGSNSNITMTNSSLTSNNSDLSDYSNSYKNIFMYQSGDGVGKSTFTATNNTITTNKGDIFYITNTKAIIKLTNNVIVNNDGNLIKSESSHWGDKGGDISLTMSKQTVSGNIVLDSSSILEMSLLSESNYTGTINGDNESSNVSLTISSDSTFSLTGDTYVSSLVDADETYSNINFNGYDLFVNGEKLVVGGGTGDGDNNDTSGGQSGSGTDTIGSVTGETGTTNSDNSLSGNSNENGSSSSGSSDKSSSNKNSSGSNKNSSGSNKNSSGSVSTNDSKKNSDSSLKNDKEQEISDQIIIDAIREDLGEDAVSDYLALKSDKVVSVRDVDSRTLLIINSVGLLFIVTSIVSLIRLKKSKEYDN